MNSWSYERPMIAPWFFPTPWQKKTFFVFWFLQSFTYHGTFEIGTFKMIESINKHWWGNFYKIARTGSPGPPCDQFSLLLLISPQTVIDSP